MEVERTGLTDLDTMEETEEIAAETSEEEVLVDSMNETEVTEEETFTRSNNANKFDRHVSLFYLFFVRINFHILV